MQLNRSSKVMARMQMVAFGAAWAIANIAVLVNWFGFDLRVAAMDAAVSVLCATFSVVVLETILDRYTPKSRKYQYVMGLSFVVAIMCQWIAHQAYTQMPIANTEYFVFNERAMPVRFAFTFLIAMGYGVAFLFYKQTKELRESANQQATNEVMIREAELQKLQLQLQPHFLFNSLNSINALILVNPSKAREMVQQLSDFLRTTLKRADEHWITLDQELTYLQLYLAIEKVRFGHRLNVQIECDDQIKLWLIPPLLIQPLVENAIKFGLYGTTEAVTIHMQTQRIDNALQMIISNPFDADMQPSEGSGFGLNGLKRRLYLLYARNDLLKTSIDNNHFTVQLLLPEKI